jgi:hypothetical protein
MALGTLVVSSGNHPSQPKKGFYSHGGVAVFAQHNIYERSLLALGFEPLAATGALVENGALMSVHLFSFNQLFKRTFFTNHSSGEFAPCLPSCRQVASDEFTYPVLVRVRTRKTNVLLFDRIFCCRFF